MADEPRGGLRPATTARSTRPGDAPEAVARRYYLDGRGGAGLGYYEDARTPIAAFRDHGRRLVATRTDPTALRDMVAVAAHRGWSTIRVEGDEAFRREAWLLARLADLEVRGYTPQTRDLQDLERRTAARDRQAGASPSRHPSPRPPTRPTPEPTILAAPLGVVKTVVHARVADSEARARILEHARQRLAHWLERRPGFGPLEGRLADRSVDQHRRHERSRGR